MGEYVQGNFLPNSLPQREQTQRLLLEPAIQRGGHCTILRNMCSREEKRIEDAFPVWKMSSEDSGSVLHKSRGWRRSEAGVLCTIIPVLCESIKGNDVGKKLGSDDLGQRAHGNMHGTVKSFKRKIASLLAFTFRGIWNLKG